MNPSNYLALYANSIINLIHIKSFYIIAHLTQDLDSYPIYKQTLHNLVFYF